MFGFNGAGGGGGGNLESGPSALRWLLGDDAADIGPGDV